jgi:hypothetical protein
MVPLRRMNVHDKKNSTVLKFLMNYNLRDEVSHVPTRIIFREKVFYVPFRYSCRGDSGRIGAWAVPRESDETPPFLPKMVKTVFAIKREKSLLIDLWHCVRRRDGSNGTTIDPPLFWLDNPFKGTQD